MAQIGAGMANGEELKPPGYFTKSRKCPLGMNGNTKNPVIEAVIDFRFTSELEIEECSSKIAILSRGDGEQSKHEEVVENTLVVNEHGVTEHRSITFGYRLRKEYPKTITQLNKYSFSFHLLRPYSNWETFVEIAERHFRKMFPESMPLERVAVRNINQIDASDLANAGLRRYLDLFPTNPFGMAAQLSGFITQLELFFPPSSKAKIIVAIPPVPEPNSPHILLDVDVYRDGLSGLSSDAAWGSVLPELRKLKNTIFRQSLSREALDDFAN